MKFEGKPKRIRDRLGLRLPVRVHCRESTDQEWVEVTRLIDVTPFGARFTIARPTEPGRILRLTMPLPRQLRCFDHVEDQYRVWALVCHAKPHSSAAGSNLPRFELGVAFIGKRPPESYETDPAKLYEIAASPTEALMWKLQERKETRHVHVPSDDLRPETRFSMPYDVIIEAFDEKGELAASEATVTEDISRHGASVFTSLDIARGRFVRITSARYQISVMAVVRGRRMGKDGIPRLHLEFIDQLWPLEGIG